MADKGQVLAHVIGAVVGDIPCVSHHRGTDHAV